MKSRFTLAAVVVASFVFVSVGALAHAQAVVAKPGKAERAQRKAIEVSLSYLSNYPQGQERGAVMAWATPVATAISAGPGACQAAGEVGQFYLVGGDLNRAGDVFVHAAKQCGNVEAAKLSVEALSRVNRCSEAIEAIQAVWPRADQSDWNALLDGVTQCSSPVALRQNLSFVPEAVRTSIPLATEGTMTGLPGGLPIIRNGVLLGGIGIGSGTGEQDVAVAAAALAAIWASAQ